MEYLLLISLMFSSADRGRLSVYYPKDGYNHGRLACGGTLTKNQVHIAYRKWYKFGCGTQVLVCSEQTQKCVMAKVMDAGPYGVYRGPLKFAKAEGRWKVHVGTKPPKGWKFRAVADLSVGLWKRLGYPDLLSNVSLFFVPKRDHSDPIQHLLSWLGSQPLVASLEARPLQPF